MNVSELLNQANTLTDENHDFNTGLGFINDGIAEINVELNANFPFVTEHDEEFSFPENWQRLVLIPFVGAKIKQKDSSQFEYSDLYGQFQANLMRMKAKYTVPEEYHGETTDSLAPDFSGNPFRW